MSDLCVARVLSQLEISERQIGDLEQLARAELLELQAPVGPGASDSWQAFRQREQFLLGQIEGLVRAQIALQDRRGWYTRQHQGLRAFDPRPAE